ncbi:MAG: iron-containing alcohol dehydrogenase [Candidatus Obscuribacterales bacterium]|nr:iron-containing alcohol dehydrogenase [Candidatus Obscuribacterales bacterium]
MNPFTFLSPTRINFGEGTAAGIIDALAELNASNPLIVTDAGLFANGILDPILAEFTNAGLGSPTVYKDVPSDSDVDCVRKGIELGRAINADSVIAVGGGSVIDTAKVINIGLSVDGDVLDFEGINNLTDPLKPLVCIPTTAGTGSEVSAVAMIKDHSTGKKLLFGSRFLYANVAILDPSLLLSLPPRLTAATGMDAVTHGLESYVAMTTNPMSDSLALQSLSMLFTSLPQATKFGDDIDARAQTLLASTIAGVAFTNAGVGIVHALAHTLGAKFSIHHGVANSIFLPHGLKFNIEAAAERYAQVWNYLCTAASNQTSLNEHFSDKFVAEADPTKAAERLLDAVKTLTNLCLLPTQLREVGVPELNDSDVADLADTAMTDPAIMFNPREATPEDLVSIIKGAY